MFYPLMLAYARNSLSVAHRAAQAALRGTGKAALAVAHARHIHRLATEVAGGVLVLAGIAQWSVPSALIVGGLALMAAIEVRS